MCLKSSFCFLLYPCFTGSKKHFIHSFVKDQTSQSFLTFSFLFFPNIFYRLCFAYAHTSYYPLPPHSLPSCLSLSFPQVVSLLISYHTHKIIIIIMLIGIRFIRKIQKYKRKLPNEDSVFLSQSPTSSPSSRKMLFFPKGAETDPKERSLPHNMGYNVTAEGMVALFCLLGIKSNPHK